VYGLVNRAVQDLVLSRHGELTWESIKARAGCPEATFVTMSTYPDEITYSLVAAASEVLDVEPAVILEAFGEYWMEYSAEAGYGDLLAMMGDDLVTFLDELDHMHDRLRTSFPELNPPSIYLSDTADHSFVLHYVSDRGGLTPFMVGLLRGAARRFGQQVEIELQRSKEAGADHDEFLVRMSQAA
jgi:hypothetical protein